MIRHTLKTAAAGLIALVFAHAAATAADFETAAKEVIIVDYATGAELFAKNADQIMEPASMTKMMTIYMLFERLKNGSLKPDDTFLVSENAWRKQASKMFVPVGGRLSVRRRMADGSTEFAAKLRKAAPKKKAKEEAAKDDSGE